MTDSIQKKKQLFWNRKMIEVFIQLYKENVCLYDINHENYENRTIKMHALKNISERMQQFLPNLELEDVQDKIKAIRTQLSEEMSLVNDAESSGNKYIPKLWCFDQLEFLRKHMTTSTANNEHDESYFFHEGNHNDADYALSDDSDVSLYREMQKTKLAQKYTWNREIITNFIQLLKKYKNLYDHKQKGYSKSSLRNDAYNKLLRETKKLDPRITLNDIRSKIHSLRTQYRKEMQYIKSNRKNNRVYFPKLWCFQMLANLYNDIDDELKPYCFLDSENMIDNKSLTESQLSEVTINENNTTNNELFQFEEIHQVMDENVVEYDEESVILPDMKITRNKENFQNITDYECVNISEYDSDVSPPAKMRRHDERSYRKNKMNMYKVVKKVIPEYSTKPINGDKSINNNEGGEFEYLGDLVLSQLGEISRRYHDDFSWDVQCLIRKYILKSRADKDEALPSNSSSSLPDTNIKDASNMPKNVIHPCSSNTSFSISFV